MKKSSIMILAILSSLMIGEAIMSLFLASFLVAGILTETLLSEREKEGLKESNPFLNPAFAESETSKHSS